MAECLRHSQLLKYQRIGKLRSHQCLLVPNINTWESLLFNKRAPYPEVAMWKKELKTVTRAGSLPALLLLHQARANPDAPRLCHPGDHWLVPNPWYRWAEREPLYILTVCGEPHAHRGLRARPPRVPGSIRGDWLWALENRSSRRYRKAFQWKITFDHIC